MKRSEVGIGLNRDVMTSFLLLKYQIWVHFGPCNSITVQPYAFETAYQCLKHILYVKYGCMKRSEVGIGLNCDVMMSFSLLK